jgi:hypothetical protein
MRMLGAKNTRVLLRIFMMLDRSKPFTLDKDRSFLHRSSLDRSICASVNGAYD